MLINKFDLKVKVKKEVENMNTDHLSPLMFEKDGSPISDIFLDDQLFALTIAPWFADIINFLVIDEMPYICSAQNKQ